ncbi:MAG TPA: glycosyltransferase [Chloroflexota bacterium]|nr:glycosyltransferase [Chloroflexota bacterium]
MRVALVHDYLNQYGGAERVLEVMHDLFPEAPIFTSIFDPDAMPASYSRMDVRTSFMQGLPRVMSRHQSYLPFYPLVFENFNLSEYDVVISNSSAWAKSVITEPATLHICYCLTPMRWAWRYHDYVNRERLGRLARMALPPVMNYLRVWDVAAANRVDSFVAISRAVADRIWKFYRRQASIIYPPVDTQAFQPTGPADDFFLVASRLIPYKRVDLVVDAFNSLGLPLKIVGDGRDRSALQARARENIEFMGRVSDAELRDLYARCRAFIFPGEEDFGIAPVEAQACGRPVIAFAAGGALDTVLDGTTGTYFRDQTPESLIEAVRRCDSSDWSSEAIRANAERFSVATFQSRFTELVSRLDAERSQGSRMVEPFVATP